ncbi:MAG: energy transducer TonB [Acidobacteriota bacterium]
MFEQTFVEGRGQTTKSWTIVVSFIGQCLLIGVAILIPLIYTDSLPRTQLTSFLVAPPPPPPPPPPPAAAPVKVVRMVPRQFDAGRLMAPKVIPKEIAMIKEDELPPVSGNVGVVGGIPGGIPGGSMGGVLGGIISSVPQAAPPPPPVVAPKPVAPQRIRVGGNVQQAKLLNQPKPVYPPLAKQARIQGTVRFNAIIGRDGAIANLVVVSGHPLLVPSALEAVRQWKYQPTLLNGEPVEVVTQIDVNFTLQ